MWSLNLSDGIRWREFADKVLRTRFVPKAAELTGGCRKLQRYKSYYLYYLDLSNNFRKIRSRRKR